MATQSKVVIYNPATKPLAAGATLDASIFQATTKVVLELI